MDTPRVVDRYRLLREVGRGAMGTVWLAYDETLHREVALKQIAQRLVGFGPDVELARERFLREARLAARLNHPNAVGVHDMVVEDGQPWLVMEYVPARTLAEVVAAEGPLDPRRAARIGAALAHALTAAHRTGIVHRDVKPANVLLGERDVPKLTDFGIARVAGEATLTASGELAGTPAYLAPELARGGEPTPACDVWALGATLYFAVEGHPPYGHSAPDAHPLALLGRIAMEPVPPPRDAGPLAPALEQLLIRNPAWRPSGAEAAELLEQVADAPAYPPPPAPAPPTPAPGRRRRIWLVAAIAGVVLLAGGVVTWLGLDRAADDPATAAGPDATAGSTSGSGSGATRPNPTAGGPQSTPPTPPTSSAGAAPPTTPGYPPTAEQMAAWVAAHYAYLPHDPASAWADLTPSMQATIGYDVYTEFWGSVGSVTASGITADPATGTARLTVAFTVDGVPTTEEHQLILVVDPNLPDYLAIQQDIRLS